MGEVQPLPSGLLGNRNMPLVSALLSNLIQKEINWAKSKSRCSSHTGLRRGQGGPEERSLPGGVGVKLRGEG